MICLLKEIGFKRGHKFKMPDGNFYSAYDTVKRCWEHLNFFQHKCFISCKVPRVKQLDGKVITQAVPCARKGSGFTLLFEAFAMLLIESEMPVNRVGKVLKVYPNRIWKIGFDETSTRKGHNYITTMVDLEQRCVLFATQGKGADCIEKSVSYLKGKNVDTTDINQVCIDMSPAFISDCMENLPNADITFDKFHVMKEVNQAMDKLRQAERKGNELLKNHQYTFLKNKLSPKLHRAFAFKDSQLIYSNTPIVFKYNYHIYSLLSMVDFR